jgi:hypothetical protein
MSTYIYIHIYIYIYLSLSISANFFATAPSDVQLVAASMRPEHTGEHCSDVKLTAARPAESRRAFRIIGNSGICSSASCERSCGTIGRSEAILQTNWRFTFYIYGVRLRRQQNGQNVFKCALMRFVKSVVRGPRSPLCRRKLTRVPECSSECSESPEQREIANSEKVRSR